MKEKAHVTILTKQFLVCTEHRTTDGLYHYPVVTHRSVTVIAHVPHRDESKRDLAAIWCWNLVLSCHNRRDCPSVGEIKLWYQLQFHDELKIID